MGVDACVSVCCRGTLYIYLMSLGSDDVLEGVRVGMERAWGSLGAAVPSSLSFFLLHLSSSLFLYENTYQSTPFLAFHFHLLHIYPFGGPGLLICRYIWLAMCYVLCLAPATATADHSELLAASQATCSGTWKRSGMRTAAPGRRKTRARRACGRSWQT